MPRKSAASLAIVAVDGARPRLIPPEGMSKDARKVFIELVAANPPQHFTQSDAPLLRQYVEMICQAEQAARAIEREGAVLPNGRANPWLGIQRGALRSMGVLANRLRLCPGARSNAETAGRAAQRYAPSFYDTLDNDRAR
jgi:phage terminase small subunit